MVFDSKNQVKPRSEEGQTPNLKAKVLARLPKERGHPLLTPGLGLTRCLPWLCCLQARAWLTTLPSCWPFTVVKTYHLHFTCHKRQVWGALGGLNQR